jgi:hypothetical protein
VAELQRHLTVALVGPAAIRLLTTRASSVTMF